MINFSSVVGSDDVVVGHFLDGQEVRTAKKSEELLAAVQIFVPSLAIFLEFLLMFFVSWLSSLAIFLIVRKVNQTSGISIISLKTFGLNLLFLRDDLNRSLVPVCLKYALLFNLVFFSLVKIVLSNNIQSSKVVVDKEALLYNENKIYTTKMRCCWFSKDGIFDFFHNSKSGLSYFIFRSKTDQIDPCVLLSEDGSFAWEHNFFSINFSYKVRMYLRIIGFAQKRSVFVNKNPLFSLNAVIYLSVTANRAIRAGIEDWIVKFVEHGWYSQLMRKNFEAVRIEIPKDDIYTSASEFVGRNTLIKVNLEYEIFQLFFHALLFVDTVFILACLMSNWAGRNSSGVRSCPTKIRQTTAESDWFKSKF